MKVFAIVTACLMAGAGGAYYLSSSTDSKGCGNHPVAQSGGCCSTETKLDCCTIPCPACASDCQTCCDVCELCCSAGVEGGVATKAPALGCCEAPPVKVTAAKPVEDDEECCPACKTPVKVATAAALAGIGSK